MVKYIYTMHHAIVHGHIFLLEIQIVILINTLLILKSFRKSYGLIKLGFLIPWINFLKSI
jgi:hypothetical protein